MQNAAVLRLRRWKYGFSLVFAKGRRFFFTSDNREGTLVDAATGIVDSTVERDFSRRNCLGDGLVSGVTSGRLLSLVPALTPSIPVRLSLLAFFLVHSIPSFSRRIDLSHALAVPRYIDPSLRLFSSTGAFFAAPSFFVAPRLPLFLVVITSLLLVISLRAIRSLDPLTGQSGARKRADANFLAQRVTLIARESRRSRGCLVYP